MILDAVLILTAFGAAVLTWVFVASARAQIEERKLVGTVSEQATLTLAPGERSERVRALLRRLMWGFLAAFLILACLSVVVAAFFWLSKHIGTLIRGTGAEHMSTIFALATILVIVLLLFIVRRGLYMRRLSSTTRATYEFMGFPRHITYHGDGRLPKRVYVGDSQTISFSFSSHAALQLAQIHQHSPGQVRKHIILDLTIPSVEQTFLEMEILAAGVEVAGDAKQRQELTMESLSFTWNCHFKNSGNHDLAFILRLIGDSAATVLGRIEHNVKVVRIDHLTQRQVWLLGSLAGIATGILGVAEVLHKLGVW
jgi:hypothetical protein